MYSCTAVCLSCDLFLEIFTNRSIGVVNSPSTAVQCVYTAQLYVQLKRFLLVKVYL